MNKMLLIAAVLFLFTLHVSGQKIKVSETSANIGSGRNTVFAVTVYDASVEDIEKDWKNEMKKLDAKVSKKKGEFMADDATWKALSENTVDIHAIIEESGAEEIKLSAGVNLGGVFLSSAKHGREAKIFEDFILDFGIRATKNAIAGKRREAEKMLAKLEREKEQLINSNGDLHRDIERWKKQIEDAEQDIRENEVTQQKKTEDIGRQKKVVEDIIAKESAVN